MDSRVERAIHAYLARHHGVMTAEAARRLGVTESELRWRVHSGRWQRVHRGVYVPAGTPLEPVTLLLAAVEAAGPGAVASLGSAAWLWGLERRAPATPHVTVPYPRDASLRGVALHRRRSRSRRPTKRQGIPVTDAMQTLIDLAGAGTPLATLDDYTDVAISKGHVRARDVAKAVAVAAGRGRPGPKRLRMVAERRGLVEPPKASVLESRVLRLLHSWDVVPLEVEVPACDGRYRIDVLLAPGLVLEVDGFAFHSSPRARSADLARRNRIRATGVYIVETDWITVTYEPERLRAEISAGFARNGARAG